jgi:CRISPR-associated protein Cas5 subtype I-B
METHNFIYACISGWTATFKVPLFYSNTGIKGIMPTMSVPPYTTIMGILGNMVGRDLNPSEVKRIGFIFEYDKKGVDLEKLESYTLDTEKDVLKRNTGTTNPTQREYLIHPKLHIYLENVALFEHYFNEPFNIPCIGRSQDIAWLQTLKNGKQYEIVYAEEVDTGIVRNTLMPFPQEGASGIIVPLVDHYENSLLGSLRKAERVNKYQVINKPATVKRNNLFKVSNRKDCVIYMHCIKE